MNKLTFDWKPFVFSAIAVFLMVSLQMGHVHQPLISPGVKDDTFFKIHSLLSQKKNYFMVKKDLMPMQPVLAEEDFNQAAAYGVLDFDSGQLLEEKNFSDKFPIASLTKLMTAVVSLDLSKSTDQFIVSEQAANIEPTKMGLVPGQKWGLEPLLHALLLTSSNDSAQVLKEGIDQKFGPETFIRAMNEKALILGLQNSHFDNPQGFDGKFNFGSVENLAILTSYALKNYPQIREIVKKDYQFYPATSEHKLADLYNWNGLLGVYPGVEGVKIGNTQKAGFCSIVLSVRNNKRLLAVVLGAPDVLRRDLWVSRLLDAGFAKIANLEPVNLTGSRLKQKYSGWKYFN